MLVQNFLHIVIAFIVTYTNTIFGQRILDPIFTGLTNVQTTLFTHGDGIDRSLYNIIFARRIFYTLFAGLKIGQTTLLTHA